MPITSKTPYFDLAEFPQFVMNMSIYSVVGPTTGTLVLQIFLKCLARDPIVVMFLPVSVASRGFLIVRRKRIVGCQVCKCILLSWPCWQLSYTLMQCIVNSLRKVCMRCFWRGIRLFVSKTVLCTLRLFYVH